MNVAAIPDALLEAEFFGVAPGAFTGAERRMRDGKLKLADGGTLLLDEIGDMPLALQAKLLRVLQEQQFEPVGSNRMIQVDVRVIAATSHDLKALVERGEFRVDLYDRLAVVPIRLPPLSERAADLPALVDHLLEAIGESNGAAVKELTEDAVGLLQGMPWPGNVRELRNLLEQACAMTERVRLTRADLLALLPPGAPGGATVSAPDGPASPVTAQASIGSEPPAALAASRDEPHPATRTLPDAGSNPISLPERIARLERDAIREALAATGGNRREAARRLGIARATLYERLKSLARS